ncbi:MAG TPA: diguanylate cyclase [Acidobacteriaceae bacterium]
MRSGIRFTGVAFLTAALAWLGLSFGRGSGPVPAIWWANAALVAVMLLDATKKYAPAKRDAAAAGQPARSATAIKGRPFIVGRDPWPLLLAAGFVGDLLAHLLVRVPLAQGFVFSACDIGEAAVAAYSFAHALGDGIDLTELRQLLRYVACGVFLAPVAAGIAAAILLQWLRGHSMALAWRWFPPHAIAMAVIPLLVLCTVRREALDLVRPRRLLNAVLYFALIAAVATIVFSFSELALLFLLIPPLLFLAVRLGASGGALACCVVAAIGAAFAIGPSGRLSPLNPGLEHRVLVLQIFLAAAVLSVSVIAAVLARLERAGRDARDHEQRYLSMAASMEMLASLDPLTQLANRRRFDEVLDNEWHRALRGRSPLSLILVDADYFQAYNNHYGQQAGDECLKKIARSLNETARRPADLVARCGGEEFAIILPDTDAEGAFALAEKLRCRIEELSISHEASPTGLVTVCGGCATMTPLVGEAAIDLLSSADEALYEAKRQGRNRIEVAVFRRPGSLDF